MNTKITKTQQNDDLVLESPADDDPSLPLPLSSEDEEAKQGGDGRGDDERKRRKEEGWTTHA